MSAGAAPQKARPSKSAKEKTSKKTKVRLTEQAPDSEQNVEIDATEGKKKSKKRKRTEAAVESVNESEPQPMEKEAKKVKKNRKSDKEESDTVKDVVVLKVDKAHITEKVDKKDKKSKKDKGSKKRAGDASNAIEDNSVETQTEVPVELLPDTPNIENGMDEVLPETKKKSKSKRNKKSRKDNVGGEDRAEDPDAGEKNATNEATEPSPNSRFIIFIGNLPFSATTESISEHFKKIQPASIRHISDKTSKKSKGFAFLEFNNYDRMKSCLKLYHHSKFDDGKSPARKINVELTAGGGGKNDNRKEKLRVKNEKLQEQRKRRAEVEGKQRQRKDKKGIAGGEVVEPEPEVEEEHSGIHPSRRSQLGF